MPSQPAEPQVSVLRESIWVLRRRYYVVLLAVVLCVGASVLLVRSQPRMYRAKTRLLIEPRRSRFSGSEADGVGPAYYYFYRFEIQTQIMLIKSRPVADRVVGRLELASKGPFREMPDPAQMVMACVNAEPVGETRFIDVSCETTDPVWSTEIANALAEEYIKEGIDHRRRLLNEAIGAYSQRYPELHEKLKQAEQELVEFHEGEFAISSDRPEEAMRAQEIELMNELLQARRDRVAAEARIKAHGADEGDAERPQLSRSLASDDPWTRELLDDRLSQISLINELSRSFSEGHPKLESAKTRLSAIEKELDQAAESYFARLRLANEAAQWKEQEITRFLKEHRGQIMKLRKRLARYEALRNRRDSLRSLLDPLARGQAELDLAANIELANASIIEKATVPRGPSRPNKVKYVLIAVVLGLALGGWLAYAIDGLDETIRTPENLKRAAPLQLVGSISRMSRRVSKHSRGRAFVADARSGFVLAEEFRSLRTGLLTAAPWKKEGRGGAVLVTSPGLGEGKTTISVNAAEAFAQLGRPVVIVDADIRRARVHEILECPRTPGLVDVLQGGVPLKDAVRQTALQNLLILPAGSVTSRPAEILASDGVGRLIQELKTGYGVVWIDSPPVMLVADSRTLVPLADLILLVVRSTSTRRRELERTYELLITAAGACEDPTVASKVVAVLNGVPYAVSKQYGYYRSAYGRYYDRPAPTSPPAAESAHEAASTDESPAAV